MATSRPKHIKTLFCPRCDKQFVSLISNADNRKQLNKHVELAHPEYLALWTKD